MLVKTFNKSPDSIDIDNHKKAMVLSSKLSKKYNSSTLRALHEMQERSLLILQAAAKSSKK